MNIKPSHWIIILLFGTLPLHGQYFPMKNFQYVYDTLSFYDGENTHNLIITHNRIETEIPSDKVDYDDFTSIKYVEEVQSNFYKVHTRIMLHQPIIRNENWGYDTMTYIDYHPSRKFALDQFSEGIKTIEQHINDQGLKLIHTEYYVLGKGDFNHYDISNFKEEYIEGQQLVFTRMLIEIGDYLITYDLLFLDDFGQIVIWQ